MKTKERMTVAYEAPMVEIVKVLVEQGFAASGNAFGDGMGTGTGNDFVNG